MSSTLEGSRLLPKSTLISHLIPAVLAGKTHLLVDNELLSERVGGETDGNTNDNTCVLNKSSCNM
jgi:hypothetical protein